MSLSSKMIKRPRLRAGDRQAGWDAFGAALWDGARGERGEHVVERDDGRVEVMDVSGYLAGPRAWPGMVRRALGLARGKVLDVGCGAGRHAIYLQGRGRQVLGIDQSPLAIRAARKRGLRRARVLDIHRIRPAVGMFDAVIMLGNNFGLFGNRTEARRLLRVFLRMTTDQGRMVVESNDVYRTSNPEHLAYQRRNRRRGRMSGQIRLRVRYGSMATPWFDYLMVSPEEMQRIVEGTGWHVARTFLSKGSGYFAVLEKDSKVGASVGRRLKRSV